MFDVIVLTDAFTIVPDFVHSTIPSADISSNWSRIAGSASAVVSVIVVIFVFTTIGNALFVIVIPFFIFATNNAFFAN